MNVRYSLGVAGCFSLCFTAGPPQPTYTTALSQCKPFFHITLFHQWEVFNKKLNRSEQLVRLSAASKVIVTTPLYELPITLTKEMWQLANPACVRHRWESLLPLLIDWEENSLNSIFHLSQSKSKLSSPLDCPPVGEGVADATLDALLLLNKCPIAQQKRATDLPPDN